ncbi:MAG: hypothetical protein ACJAR2_003984 [Ilumatobacter sp.]|jgi:hypothetical protein
MSVPHPIAALTPFGSREVVAAGSGHNLTRTLVCSNVGVG